jgi:hypothetical protein
MKLALLSPARALALVALVALSVPVSAEAQQPPPQVSPVDQFNLNGPYLFAPRTENGKTLNEPTAGTVEIDPFQAGQQSAQWVFEAVPDTPFVRIKNRALNAYLADADGVLQAMQAAPDDGQAQWTFEPVDGTSFVQLRNRESDRFLFDANGSVALIDSFTPEYDNASHWQVAQAVGPAGRPYVLSKPQARPVYEAAVASCRALGGYWTGSSCRGHNIAQPLACPRNWVWSSSVGECIWSGGGHCPPWEAGPGGTCQTNIACSGGSAAVTDSGYAVCNCPYGMVTWGNYPNLACVPRSQALRRALSRQPSASISAGKDARRSANCSAIANSAKGSPSHPIRPPAAVAAAEPPDRLPRAAPDRAAAPTIHPGALATNRLAAPDRAAAPTTIRPGARATNRLAAPGRAAAPTTIRPWPVATHRPVARPARATPAARRGRPVRRRTACKTRLCASKTPARGRPTRARRTPRSSERIRRPAGYPSRPPIQTPA